MGNDFVQKTKKSFRKGCDRERKKLTLSEFGLFGTSKKIRAILCVPYSLDHFSDGRVYELNLERDRIFVYAEGVDVGVCIEPPQSVLQELSALGGKTLGAFHKVREHSEMVEIVIALESESKAGEAA